MGKDFGPRAAAYATKGNSEDRSVSSTSNGMLKIATVLQQIITEISAAVSGKDEIMVITKKVFNLMKQNGC
jgi:hypothetical protein